MEKATCTVNDCARIQWSSGLCALHYDRRRRTGSVDLVKRPTVEERFWSGVDKTGDCWLWTGFIIHNGYGQFSHGARPSRKEVAHRFAYRLAHGEIPEGLHLDHLCRVRRCVNPAHLEPVTQAVNNERAAAVRVRKTHCPHGHEYAGANLIVSPKNRFICRTCLNARRRLRRARGRADAHH